MTLAHRLGEQRAVYVLDDGVVQSHRIFTFETIEEAASTTLSLVSSILRSHYQGRKGHWGVHLGGWSYGGVLAVEVAKQLGVHGHDVNIDLLSVSMFDAPLRGDVVSEEQDDQHLHDDGEGDSILSNAQEHFQACTKLLRIYHRRPQESKPLQCKVLDIRPIDGQILAGSSVSVPELTSGSIEKKSTPGDHWTMLSKEHVDSIVALLNEFLA